MTINDTTCLQGITDHIAELPSNHTLLLLTAWFLSSMCESSGLLDSSSLLCTQASYCTLVYTDEYVCVCTKALVCVSVVYEAQQYRAIVLVEVCAHFKISVVLE